MKQPMDAETLNLLQRAGLNQYESRVYLALLQAGPTSAGDTADLANIPRPRTYDVLEKLEKKGFVAIQPGRPTKFFASKPGEAFDALKRKKQDDFNKELIELEKIKARLHEHAKTTKPETTTNAEDYVWVLKDRKNIHSKLEALVNNAQTSVLLAASHDALAQKLEHLDASLRKAKKRGV